MATNASRRRAAELVRAPRRCGAWLAARDGEGSAPAGLACCSCLRFAGGCVQTAAERGASDACAISGARRIAGAPEWYRGVPKRTLLAAHDSPWRKPPAAPPPGGAAGEPRLTKDLPSRMTIGGPKSVH